MSKFKVGDRVLDWDQDPCEVLEVKDTEGGEPSIRVRYENKDYDQGGCWFEQCLFRMASTEGPVRTVTRREIVPGAYGDVDVFPSDLNGFKIVMNVVTKDANRLRSAAMILSQIAEALDDKETTK